MSTTSPTPAARSTRTRTTLSAISVSSRRLRGPLTAMIITGSLSLSNFGDDRRIGVLRQIALNVGHAVAHVLRGHVDVAVEVEVRDDERAVRHRDRAQLVDALDGVDRFFDLVGDLGLDLGGRRAGQAGPHEHRRHVDRREAIDAEARQAHEPDDDEREVHHRGEHRAADADLSELLHTLRASVSSRSSPISSCSVPVVRRRSR